MTMDTQAPAPLPCPFCGSPARLLFHDGFCWCECTNHRDCGAVQPVCNHADVAVKTWNRRSGLAALAESRQRIEALEKELAELKEAERDAYLDRKSEDFGKEWGDE